MFKSFSLSLYIYIYIYIKWTVFVNVTTKSAQHAHARMIAIIVEKSPNSSHMYDHGFMDNTNRQAVKNWLDSQTRDASLTSWRQPFCKSTKWLPPWRKGRISCLWIKSVFDCLTIGIIHETMVVHMTWVWTFFNNYIYIYCSLILHTARIYKTHASYLPKIYVHWSCFLGVVWFGTFQSHFTWANVDTDLCRHMASPSHNELSEQNHIVLTLSSRSSDSNKLNCFF